MKTAIIKQVLIALLVLVSAGLRAQTQERNVGDFTGIRVGGIFTVTVTPGDANKVTVDADPSVMDKIKTEVKGDVLVIGTDGKFNSEKPITVHVTIKELKKVDVGGAAKLTGIGSFATSDMWVMVSGAGSAELEVNVANTLEVDGSGAADVKMSGTANDVKTKVSGAASFKAYDLEAKTASINASGAASAKVNVKESVVAEASGASSVQYKGRPASKVINKSGTGSVRDGEGGEEQESGDAGAQDGVKNDTTRLRLGTSHVIIINDEKEKAKKTEEKKKSKKHSDDFNHWSGIDLGVNGYLDADNKLSLPGRFDFMELDYARSYSFALNFYEKDIHLYRNYLNIVTGLGLEFNNYAFKNNTTLLSDMKFTSASWDSIEYSTNKLRTTFINLPLMIEVNTSSRPRKAFHIASGVIVGYKLGSKTKQEFDLNGREFEIKEKDDFNLAPFRCSATVRAGYGGFTLFANYALTTLFEKNKGPRLYPFSAGIALNFD